jgi:hypothetical protein
MATSGEIAEVRLNTDEPSETSLFLDKDIAALIDEGTVEFASGQIWMQKAAAYAKLVNVSEAGASHDFGTLQDKALQMATLFGSGGASGGAGSGSDIAPDGKPVGGYGHVRIHTIDR